MNTIFQRLAALIAGLVLNAFGNGLAISTDMGAPPWSAAEVNIATALGFPISITIFVVGSCIVLINLILIRKLDLPRFIGEIVFMLAFSYVINISTRMFSLIGIPKLSLLARLFLCLIGITILCVAISFYQRANLIMHPNDDTTNILRFVYFKGNVIWAQIINFVFPVFIIFICFILTHKIYSFNLGTIICVFFNGPLIMFADTHLWKKLHHNFNIN